MSPLPPYSGQFVWLNLIILLVGFSTHMASSQSLVEYLPGFRGKLPFQLETGYIGLGESEEIQLFYYYIESERSPENDPLILWLQGGPGCSGFSGLVFEIGPLIFDYGNFDGDIPTLLYNPYSWTKVANVIFLDQPVGAGFSYAKSPEAYKSNDTISAKLTYYFLRKWLINHPKYLKNPLYIAGESYCGIPLPLLVNEVYDGIDAGSEPHLNMKILSEFSNIYRESFDVEQGAEGPNYKYISKIVLHISSWHQKGYILGNPITDKFGDLNGRVDYAHRMGLLSDELYQSAKENCNGYYLSADLGNDLCKNDLERVNQCVGKIYLDYILAPWCDLDYVNRNPLLHHMPSPHEESAARFLQSVPLRDSELWCRPMNYLYSHKWANIKLVQKALHVREGTITKWARCNRTIEATYTYNVNSTVNYHKKFTNRNDCRALILSGDHDMAAPHTATEEWIRSLKLDIQSDWRPWFVEGQIAGYTTAYVNGDYEMTYATVKGAGHTAPEYKPRECLSMVDRWLSSSPL